MRALPKISRRSFFSTVAGAAVGSSLIVTGARAAAQGCTDSDPSPPGGDAGGQGRNCANRPQTGCSDADAGASGDPVGAGRTCSAQPQTGCSDSDSGPNGDPGGAGRNCQQGPANGCSDRDPSDPTGRGRNCGGARTGESQPTGRRERTYEVCWVDSPNRRDEECNIQTYTEWQTTYSDGRTVRDTADADARKAEMERRGYTARWTRVLQDW